MFVIDFLDEDGVANEPRTDEHHVVRAYRNLGLTRP